MDSTKAKPKGKRPEGVLVNGKRIMPPKVPKGFPLTAHSSGKYCVYRNRKMYYYGKWFTKRRGEVIINPDAWRNAWDEFRQDEPDLAQGREPQPRDDGAVTIGALCNAFHAAKSAQVASGELSARSLREYRKTTDRIVAHFGPSRSVDDLRPDDFGPLRAEITKQWGPVRTGNEVQRVRTVFKFAFDNGLIEKPVRFGSMFQKPTKAVMRKHRAARGRKVFEADEIRMILDVLDGKEVTIGTDDDGEPIKVKRPRNPSLRAMVLLGINAGFYASDCAALPIDAIDLDRQWLDFPRPKTGIPRQVPLWGETVSALREVLAIRPEPRSVDDAGLVFITKQRQRFVREGANGCPIDAIGPKFSKVRDALKLNKAGRGFSALRHSFRTIADGAKDQPAAGLVMGHADDSIADVYRHGISDDRLRDVVDHVHQWLFPSNAE